MCVVQQSVQIAAQAVGIVPDLFFRLPGVFAQQGDFYAGEQHGFGAQQAFQFGEVGLGVFKIASVWPHAHFRAAFAGGAFADFGQRFGHCAVCEDDAADFAVAADGGFQPCGKGVGNGYADTVQPAGEGVCACAVLFGKLAACVQPREHEFQHGDAFVGVDAGGDAAPVVAHGNRAVLMQGNGDFFGETAKGFVGGVVDYFLDDVGGAVGAGVHARTFFDGF